MSQKPLALIFEYVDCGQFGKSCCGSVSRFKDVCRAKIRTKLFNIVSHSQMWLSTSWANFEPQSFWFLFRFFTHQAIQQSLEKIAAWQYQCDKKMTWRGEATSSNDFWSADYLQCFIFEPSILPFNFTIWSLRCPCCSFLI